VTIIKGRVVQGNGIGRTIGYPTANIAVDCELDVTNGVYAAVVDYGGTNYPAMVNLGIKPTVTDGCERTLEVHLLGFTGDLYGAELTVSLTHFIRSERKFASTEELREQIEKDKIQIEHICNLSFG
jgi:riboflavin kinase/FMN adenylyltransferase